MSRTAPRPTKPDAIALLAALNPTGSPEPAAITGRASKPKPGARAGTRLIAGHFPPTTLRALKHIMAEEEVTLQALLDEAIHDLLVKKGRAKLIQS
jgi:hypothetical protein